MALELCIRGNHYTHFSTKHELILPHFPRQVRLAVDPEQPWLCGSPDGLVVSSGTAYLVEIKCPFILQESMLIDHIKGVSHLEFL